MFPLFPHALHIEMAQLAAGPAAVPYVPTRVEVQRIDAAVHLQSLREKTLDFIFIPAVNKDLFVFVSVMETILFTDLVCN